jgi:chemotaxis protein MotB
MLKWTIALLLAVAAVVGALWWLFHRPQQQALLAAQAEAARLQAELARTTARVGALTTRVSDLEAVRDALQRSGSELQQRVAEKENELAALKGTQEELVSGLEKEIAARQVQVERFRDQLRVDVVDELLFDSGEAELKPAGRELLRRVAGALGKAEGRRIQVDGHTDDVPISGVLAKRYPTNWELSAARAVNVARVLQEAGVDPSRLSAAAYSEYRPRAKNDSEEGRRKNRRIEILLGPRLAAAAQPPVP